MDTLRARRHPVTRARGYRVAVPLLIALVGIATLIVLVLAGGILLGVLPYSGR